jgi:hypothetical protein
VVISGSKRFNIQGFNRERGTRAIERISAKSMAIRPFSGDVGDGEGRACIGISFERMTRDVRYSTFNMMRQTRSALTLAWLWAKCFRVHNKAWRDTRTQ